MSKRRGRGPRPDARWVAFFLGEGEAPAPPDPAALAGRTLAAADPDGETPPIPQLDGAIAASLAQALRHKRDVAALARCADQGGPDLARAAKAALGQLRRRGVQPTNPAPPAAESPPIRTRSTAAAGEADSWGIVSTPVAPDQRHLIFRFRTPVANGLFTGACVISDVRGLKQLMLAARSAKAFREMAESRPRELPVARLDFPSCLRLVKIGAAITRARGRRLPPEYQELRHLIGDHWHPAESHPMQPQADAARHDRDPGVTDEAWTQPVVELPETRFLIPDHDVMEGLQQRRLERLQSPIVLSPAQTLSQRAGLLEWGLGACFAAGGRQRWSERLLDAAYVARENRRGVGVERLLALWAALQDEAIDPATLPFFRHLVGRFLDETEPSPGPETQSPTPSAGLLWTPDQEGGAPTRGSALWTPGGIVGSPGGPPTEDETEDTDPTTEGDASEGGGLILPGR